MEKILIYGLGLMGGSLALAIKNKIPKTIVHGLSKTSSEKEEAISLKIANEVFTESEFLKNDSWNDYNLIIYCLPVNLICQKIPEIPDSFNGIITDIGSSKKEIIRIVEKKFSDNIHNYYSSHPMAGSEHTGCRYSKEDLFEGRLCIMTPPESVNPIIKKKLEGFWNLLGMQTLEIEADAHDEVLAYLSHSPHIISSILVNWSEENLMVRKYSKKSPIPLTGGGFRDMSRIAGSNPEMWDAIINSNRDSIYNSLVDFRKRITSAIEILESNPKKLFWKEFFELSQKRRNEILKISNFSSNSTEKKSKK